MPQRAPTGLSAAGKRLWLAVTTDYVLDEHERRLLLEASRTVDLLDDLDAAVRKDGVLVSSPQGDRAHPVDPAPAVVDAGGER